MKKEEKILFWSERVQEFYSSGQTCRTWCQEHQIPVSTMSYWIRKLKNVDSVSVKEDAPVFAKMPTEQELRRKELVSSQPSSSIHIFLNDSIRIEICPSCPSELLSAIIKELRHHA
uniref:IS66 family insertion sequence element accessory protein TnpA n=1 Tax=Anaerobutyricum hallii TaxID=39488 RepID=UPI003FEECDF3